LLAKHATGTAISKVTLFGKLGAKQAVHQFESNMHLTSHCIRADIEG